MVDATAGSIKEHMRKFNAISVCEQCDKEFGTYTWELNRGRGRFCSKECAGREGGIVRSLTIDQNGSENPNWKGGISSDNYHYKLIQKERYPERIKARQICYDAVRAGKLKRHPCELCGNTNAQAHHDDYSKPLDVRWLCPAHHRVL